MALLGLIGAPWLTPSGSPPIIAPMLLKAGALSLALLLASRVLGLLRETAQAAAFGVSGAGDVAVLMLTLPDWFAGLLASGALAYVLLPHWAAQSTFQQQRTQRRVALALLVMGVLVGLLQTLLRMPLVHLLASGLAPGLRADAAQALVWAAAALPLALLAALWVTRLQHERDFVGLYAANLVVNAVLIASLLLIAWLRLPLDLVTELGLGLLAAMLLRLAWLRWRLGQRVPALAPESADRDAPLPRTSLWLWAALASGLPLALPFVARSLASQAGEGALTSFNYAWKLVELPLVLAVQLVATLAFPAITRAMNASSSKDRLDAPARQAIRSAFALAWLLACAAAAALVLAAPAIASLLFGWGRMRADGLAELAAWGALGAWSLLAQALIAVALTVLAVRGQMRLAVLAYGLGMALLLLAGSLAHWGGGGLMLALDGIYAGVALLLLRSLTRGADGLLPWRALLWPLLALLSLAALAQWPACQALVQDPVSGLAAAALAALTVLLVGLSGSAELRNALRR